MVLIYPTKQLNRVSISDQTDVEILIFINRYEKLGLTIANKLQN